MNEYVLSVINDGDFAMKQFTFSDMNRASGEILEAYRTGKPDKAGQGQAGHPDGRAISKVHRSLPHAVLWIARRAGRHSSGIDDRLGRYHRDGQCLSLGRSSGLSICGAARRRKEKSQVARQGRPVSSFARSLRQALCFSFLSPRKCPELTGCPSPSAR
jgi:hypothetical protein